MKIFEDVNSFDLQKKREFYERLAFNLTIGVRGIWSDPKTSDTDKIESMKEVNELSHHIFHWLWKIRNETRAFDDFGARDEIINRIKSNRGASGHIFCAITSTHEYIIKTARS